MSNPPPTTVHAEPSVLQLGVVTAAESADRPLSLGIVSVAVRVRLSSPVFASGPVAPVAPVLPVAPVAPVGPVGPVTPPVAPVGPVPPVTPVDVRKNSRNSLLESFVEGVVLALKSAAPVPASLKVAPPGSVTVAAQVRLFVSICALSWTTEEQPPALPLSGGTSPVSILVPCTVPAELEIVKVAENARIGPRNCPGTNSSGCAPI